jgi:hypothetical protein
MTRADAAARAEGLGEETLARADGAAEDPVPAAEERHQIG